MGEAGFAPTVEGLPSYEELTELARQQRTSVEGYCRKQAERERKRAGEVEAKIEAIELRSAELLNSQREAETVGNYGDIAKADSAIKQEQWDVAPLPSKDGAKPGAGCLGDWNLGVSKFSTKQKEALEAVRILTGQDMQRMRFLEGGFLPARPAVFDDPDVRIRTAPQPPRGEFAFAAMIELDGLIRAIHARQIRAHRRIVGGRGARDFADLVRAAQPIGVAVHVREHVIAGDDEQSDRALHRTLDRRIVGIARAQFEQERHGIARPAEQTARIERRLGFRKHRRLVARHDVHRRRLPRGNDHGLFATDGHQRIATGGVLARCRIAIALAGDKREHHAHGQGPGRRLHVISCGWRPGMVDDGRRVRQPVVFGGPFTT
jgi:hypothetical protein